jgi:hypothetical protein
MSPSNITNIAICRSLATAVLIVHGESADIDSETLEAWRLSTGSRPPTPNMLCTLARQVLAEVKA